MKEPSSTYANRATSAYCQRYAVEQLIHGVSDTSLALNLEQMGERIRALREKAGMSQEALARAVEAKSSSDVSRWERGLVAPRAENLARLAHVFRVSTDYILRGAESSRPPEAEARLQAFLATPFGQQAVSNGWTDQLRKMSPPRGTENELYRHAVLLLLERNATAKKVD